MRSGSSCRRTTKTVNGTTTYFLSSGDDEIAEYDRAGTLLRRYVPGADIDRPVAMVAADGTKSFFHPDKLGSIVAMSDASGNLTEGPYTYDEYGNCQSSAGAACASGVPYRFTGRRFDPETGLYYYRARYYSASLGRFLQTDPIGYKDDINWYAYVGNDPTNKIDPSGLRNCPPEDKSCAESPESAQKPGDPPPVGDGTKADETVVIEAWRKGKDGDGNSIPYGDGHELSWYNDDGKLKPGKLSHLRDVQCGHGVAVSLNAVTTPQGSTKSHDHPDSFGPPGAVPGPGDGAAAKASNNHDAFVLTSGNLFTIEYFSNGSFRVRSQNPMTDAQRSQASGSAHMWENPPPAAASASDQQTYCPR